MKNSKLSLKSSVFENEDFIPSLYTCDGDNINPPLSIDGVPEDAQSLVLIMDDPDATAGETWDHWLVWNIKPMVKEIVENGMPEGAVQGMTSFEEVKYGGSCPPRKSSPHHYNFKLYALDKMLDLIEGAAKKELEDAIKGHILDETVLVGLYAR